jgi:hypothetical protein
MFGSVPTVSFAGIGHGAATAWQRARSCLHGLAPRQQAMQASAPRHLRPVVVPASLDDLCGPASGVVELPVRLYWSGSRKFDLTDQHQVADMCEAVLDVAATSGDITAYLNAGLLIHVWPVLGMSRAKRDAWESQFPVLRRQRLAAAA